jgi:uncharacterized peroxidase-related enzyme
MFWIQHIEYSSANPKLKKIYKRVKGPDDQIDNILKVHSLRPHSLLGHMGLYKNVLHHFENSVPKWYLETLGVYVSHINQCQYCVDHHFIRLKKLWDDELKSTRFMNHLTDNNLNLFFDEKWMSGIRYAETLTLKPIEVSQSQVAEMKKYGFVDGEILEINQVVSYFNYANRTVLGLGVHSKGDILGLSPNTSEDPDNWNHQ